MQHYLDRTRAALERDYPEFASFEERFEVPDEMYEELIGLGLEQGVTPPAEDSDVEAGTGACSKHCWQSGFSTGKLCCGYCTQGMMPTSSGRSIC